MRCCRLLPILLLAAMAPVAHAVPPPPAAFAGRHEATAEDRAAIERLLDAYPRVDRRYAAVFASSRAYCEGGRPTCRVKATLKVLAEL